MRKYTFYLTIFGKKLKFTDIEADNEFEAQQKVMNKITSNIKFDAVIETEEIRIPSIADIFGDGNNIFGIDEENFKKFFGSTK